MSKIETLKKKVPELDTDSFYPDIFVELSIRDYLNKKDPILERIREISRWPH